MCQCVEQVFRIFFFRDNGDWKSLQKCIGSIRKDCPAVTTSLTIWMKQMLRRRRENLARENAREKEKKDRSKRLVSSLLLSYSEFISNRHFLSCFLFVSQLISIKPYYSTQMSHSRLLLSLVISIFLVGISSVHSTLLSSEMKSSTLDDQYADDVFLHLIRNILAEPNFYERTLMLNQLREHLNRLCLQGLFGSSHAHACQRVIDVMHQSSNADTSSDTSSNEQHGIQKRFFCNGFIGCKNSAGWLAVDKKQSQLKKTLLR